MKKNLFITYVALRNRFNFWLDEFSKTHRHTHIYIKWNVFGNVTTKSAQHAHARMIAIIVEKSPNSSHLYDHGFMDVIPIVR